MAISPSKLDKKLKTAMKDAKPPTIAHDNSTDDQPNIAVLVAALGGVSMFVQ